MTAGIAGRLSRVRMPEPWTGAEKLEGIVGFTLVAVGTAVMVDVLVAAAATTATEDDLAAPRFTSRRALEVPTPTLMPPSLSPRRGEAVAEATKRARVVNCIVKSEAVKRLIARRHRRV